MTIMYFEYMVSDDNTKFITLKQSICVVGKINKSEKLI